MDRAFEKWYYSTFDGHPEGFARGETNMRGKFEITLPDGTAANYIVVARATRNGYSSDHMVWLFSYHDMSRGVKQFSPRPLT
jgi:hypothetical protein